MVRTVTILGFWSEPALALPTTLSGTTWRVPVHLLCYIKSPVKYIVIQLWTSPRQWNNIVLLGLILCGLHRATLDWSPLRYRMTWYNTPQIQCHKLKHPDWKFSITNKYQIFSVEMYGITDSHWCSWFAFNSTSLLGPVSIGCSVVACALVPLWSATQTLNLCFD